MGLYLAAFRRPGPGFVELCGLLYFGMFLLSPPYASYRCKAIRQKSGTALESHKLIKHSLLSSVDIILLLIWSRWFVVQNWTELLSFWVFPDLFYDSLFHICLSVCRNKHSNSKKSLWHLTTAIHTPWGLVAICCLSWLTAGDDQIIY